MAQLRGSQINGANSSYGRRSSDFYPTPPDVTVALLNFLSLPSETRIWEPACGDGRMVRVLQDAGYEVVGTDIQSGVDFLTTPFIECDWIITNPPFNKAAEFIQRCLDYERPFALLLKSQYWNAAKRFNLFKQSQPSWFLPLTWRPDFTGKGQAMMDMAWCIWDKCSVGETKFKPLERPR